MALNWFSQPKASNVDDLIRRKKYGQAIAVIKVAIKKRPADKRLLRRLADVLVLVGQIKEAVKVLNTLADEVALRGNAAEAIAILKKIQKLAPGEPDVEDKLAYYITHKSKKKAKSEWEMRRRPQASPDRPAAQPAGFELGMEEISTDSGIELGSAVPEPPPLHARRRRRSSCSPRRRGPTRRRWKGCRTWSPPMAPRTCPSKSSRKTTCVTSSSPSSKRCWPRSTKRPRPSRPNGPQKKRGACRRRSSRSSRRRS